MVKILEIPFQRCTWILCHDPYTAITRFWDGAVVEAIPVPERDTPTAEAHGYGSDWLRLFVHHDLSHCVVASALGYPYSPVLRRVATLEREPAWLTPAMRWDEEGLVMGLQACVNGGPLPTVPAWYGRQEQAPWLAYILACVLAQYGALAR